MFLYIVRQDATLSERQKEMTNLQELRGRYLSAADVAWNVYHVTLSLEQWAASRGMGDIQYRKLRAYLRNLGIV